MNQSLDNTEFNTDLPNMPGIYWPFKYRPGSRIAAYAMACVEAVLKYSEEAKDIYKNIIQCWELPGCQSVIRESTKYNQDTETWLSSLDKAVVGDEPLTDFPNEWADVFMKTEGNTDFQKLLEHASILTVVGFNRKVDLKIRKPKILPVQAPGLGLAIVTLSLMDYLAENPEIKGPAALSDKSTIKYIQFSQRLAASPSARKERGTKHEIVQTLRRREGYSLCNFERLADDAEKWYKSRVNPGTIDSYVAELAEDGINIDRSNIENSIAPCDEATGYPRKWRK